MSKTESNNFSRALQATRGPFILVGVISLAVNLLMLTAPIYLMQVFDRVLASGSRATLLYLTVVVAGALLMLALLDVIRTRILARLATWFEARLAPEGLARSVDEKLARNGAAGDALWDLSVMRSFLSSSAMLTLFDAPWVPFYIAVIYLLDPLLGHVALAGALLLFGLAVANDRLTHEPIKEASRAGQGARAAGQAALRNAEVIDAMRLSGGLVRRWARHSERALALHAIAATRAAAVVGTAKFVRLFVQVGLIGTGSILVLRHDITGGAMMAGAIIMSRALAPVEQAISAWKQAVQALDAKRRLAVFFDKPPRRTAGMRLPVPRGELAVENVVYGFGRERPPVLKGISFRVSPGEALAVLGHSAAGKSTLARLLIGIDRPDSGAVRLDGAEIYHCASEELGRSVGFLPQDVELFSGSVAENIARLEVPDPEKVVAAASMAHCHDMILRLDHGYGAELGEGGARLSGGQRQRVALARALYGSPKLVVLDEPNASLDGAGERALNQAIIELKARGAAVIVIGHRPATLAAVDRILVLADGKIQHLGSRQQIVEALTKQLSDSGAAVRPTIAVKPESAVVAAG
jgi:PrtD family type I secretion system ABC transporter